MSSETMQPFNKNIVLVIGDLATLASGPNAVVQRLAAWLVGHGYNVTVVGTWREHRPSIEELGRLYGGARIVLHRRYLKDSWHFAPGVVRLALQLLISGDRHVLDIHSVWLFNGIVLSLVGKLKGWRYLVTLHGNLRPGAMRKNKMAKMLALTLLWRWWLRTASAVVALNEQEKSEALAELRGASISIISNGVTPHCRALTSQRNKEVLFLGRLDPIKNVESLIEGFCKVADEFPDWILRITGPAANQQYLKELKARCPPEILDRRIVFRNAVYGLEKESLLLTASIFALTSWSEGQPFAVLEALAHGLPVLLSDRCNIDLPQTCGRVCGCSPDTVAQGLKELFSTEPMELMKMRSEASNFVMKTYAEDSVFDQRRFIYFPRGESSEAP